MEPGSASTRQASTALEPARTPLAAEHAAQGVAFREYHGALVPSRFSDPQAEHRAVRSAAGIFDFSFRSAFAVQGEHRVRFLQRIISNDVKSLKPGEGTYATLLNARGHIVADFHVELSEDEAFIETDADLREKTMLALGRYIIGERVELKPLPLAAVSVQGPQARDLLGAALGLRLELPHEYNHRLIETRAGAVRIVRASSTGEEGYNLWLAPEHALEAWRLLLAQAPARHALPCGTEALESLRIEAGIPRYGSELAEDTLPLEAGLYNALSFTKGCYIGQEIVERARSRGHVNWKLSGLAFESADPIPAAGEKLLADGKVVGEVTSACFSPTLGRPIALAYLRREFTEPGSRLAVGPHRAGVVTALPFYGRSAA